MDAIITITTTADSREALEHIGRRLLTKRLIACIQIVGPIKSLYWWKENMEEAEEWLGIMKTREPLYREAEAEIVALHPYEVPEVIGIEPVEVLTTYAQWVCEETKMGQTT
ncbi:MAG: putative divalent cation tolerance protein [Deltaproteobacteria bacterium]|jgi:periplasmic divalent cation tolerance protein|nr:putative divalent cation tolerance protein [Deltaproteobacteria bacterium]